MLQDWPSPVAAVMQGSDKPPFDAVYATYSHRLVGFICRFLQTDIEDAKDLAQDTFVKAWKAWPSFEPRHEGSVEDWVFRIAKHICIDAARHRQLVRWQRWDSAQYDAALADHDPLTDSEQVAIDRESARLSRWLVRATLAPKDRRVVALVAAGATYPEMERALGVTRGSLKATLFRIRAQLRRRVGRKAVPRNWLSPKTLQAIQAARGSGVSAERLSEHIGACKATIYTIWRRMDARLAAAVVAP